MVTDMSYGMMGYRVDLDLLARKIGIQEKTARMQVRRAVMNTFTARRNDGKDFSIAVSNLLIGPPYNQAEASALGYALEALCDALGTSLFNNPVSPFKGPFLEDTHAHLQELGIKLVLDLAYRGAPIELPRADEFPMIGYLTPPELEALAAAFEGKDLCAATRQLSTKGDNGILEASEMFRDWVREARQHNQGIVAFHY